MSSETLHPRVVEAIEVLKELGLPRAQLNERSGLSLLALLDLKPESDWADVVDPLMGITPIMDWARQHYGKDYAPNTRETVRRQSMHQFVQAGIALYNPDQPLRPVNSPKAVYQIEPQTLRLLRKFRTKGWKKALAKYRATHGSLVDQYAKERLRNLVPVLVDRKMKIDLSPGEHSELIKRIVEEFAPRFVPGAILVYVGDTGDKWGYFDRDRLSRLGVSVDSHGKMPDVILFLEDRNWLVLVESVTRHGPVDAKRHHELSRLFGKSSAGLIFVTAFPDRSLMGRYLTDIAWESEVWVANAPSHLIHFNGDRFLGPHP